MPAEANGKGRVTIVYQDDAIQPENRDAIKKIRDSGVFERMADRITKVVALPHDLQVIVIDKLPKAIDCPTTELDGRTIFWPAAFSKATHDVRAMLCRKEWTQLNYGWWTMLEPHLTESYKQETGAARQQARKDLEDENKALLSKFRQMRGQQ